MSRMPRAYLSRGGTGRYQSLSRCGQRSCERVVAGHLIPDTGQSGPQMLGLSWRNMGVLRYKTVELNKNPFGPTNKSFSGLNEELTHQKSIHSPSLMKDHPSPVLGGVI